MTLQVKPLQGRLPEIRGCLWMCTQGFEQKSEIVYELEWSQDPSTKAPWGGHRGLRRHGPSPCGLDIRLCSRTPLGPGGPFHQTVLKPRQCIRDWGHEERIQKLGEVSSVVPLCGRGHRALQVDRGCVCVCVCVCET